MLKMLIHWIYPTFVFDGKRYSSREWEVVPDPSDTPPFHDMGPNYVWKPDMMVRRR